MKVLTFGGCHTYAYGIENINDGYFQQYINYLKTRHDNVEVKAFAPITIKAVSSLISSKTVLLDDYDVVILQLGNYEFDINLTEIQKLFRPKNNRKYAIFTSDFSLELNEKLIAERRSWYLKEKKISKTYRMLKNCMAFPIIIFLCLYQRWFKIPRVVASESYVKELFDLLTNYSGEVIIISTFPSYGSLSNFLRGLGSDVLQKESISKKFKFLNSRAYIDNSSKYFLWDGNHLSEEGHAMLFRGLTEMT